MGCQIIIDHLEGFRTIIVVCVNNGKRAIQDIDAAENSMPGSPWFYAAFRHRKSIRNILKFLKNISNFHKSLCSFADGLTENLFVFSFNNKDHLFEACADSIINGKINDDMSIGIDGVNLFQPAITAAHAGCHNYKYRFLHLSVPSLY